MKIGETFHQLLSESNSICTLQYESDSIRLKELQLGLSKELSDSNKTLGAVDLYKTEWLSEALNKEGYIDYYEFFIKTCWDGMFSKPEYKGLTKQEGVRKLVNERFTKIATHLNLKIIDWNYKSNILNIKFQK